MRFYKANLGDSTAFLFEGEHAIQLSEDHRLSDEDKTRYYALEITHSLGDFGIKTDCKNLHV